MNGEHQQMGTARIVLSDMTEIQTAGYMYQVVENVQHGYQIAAIHQLANNKIGKLIEIIKIKWITKHLIYF